MKVSTMGVKFEAIFPYSYVLDIVSCNLPLRSVLVNMAMESIPKDNPNREEFFHSGYGKVSVTDMGYVVVLSLI